MFSMNFQTHTTRELVSRQTLIVMMVGIDALHVIVIDVMKYQSFLRAVSLSFAIFRMHHKIIICYVIICYAIVRHTLVNTFTRTSQS